MGIITFSSTVSVGSNWKNWKTMPMLRARQRVSLRSPVVETSTPSTTTTATPSSPTAPTSCRGDAGRCRPASERIRVPGGPNRGLLTGGGAWVAIMAA